ncbi:hypothetical protein JCM3765_005091 [Sporobolomyces pararoseus]
MPAPLNPSSHSPPSSTSSSPTGRTFPSTSFTITIPSSHQVFDSASNSPRRKRHASLGDAGHFRCRSVSSRDSSIYLSPASTPQNEKVKAFEFEPKLPSNLSAFETRKGPQRGRLAKVCVGILALLVLGVMVRSRKGEGREWWSARVALESLVGIDSTEASSCNNPYSELGRLAVDLKVPEKNRWKPYDSTCTPPPFLAILRKALRAKTSSDEEPATLAFPLPRRMSTIPSLPLPWLQGKTVLLFGDQVERNHNKDLCRFAGGQFATIGRDDPLSPPRFVNGIDEKLPGASQENSDSSRPAVCYIAEYDFALISVFHYGLVNRVEIERENLLEDPNFYPPVALEDRLTHIVLPILDTLNRTQPDLIEFSTGLWDLRHFTAIDEIEKVDPHAELSSDRLTWYSERLTRAFADLADVFPHTPLLWRAMYQSQEGKESLPARVAALDALSRKIVKYLNESASVGEAKEKIVQLIDSEDGTRQMKRYGNVDGGKMRANFRNRGRSKAHFLNKVKQRIGSSERIHEIVFGSDSTTLRGKITIDEWATLLRGQEHSVNDSLPGGYLWADMMLFFLHELSSPPHFRS